MWWPTLGVCVVQRDGKRVGAAGASLRTVAFPLSFLLFGAGFFSVLSAGTVDNFTI